MRKFLPGLLLVLVAVPAIASEPPSRDVRMTASATIDATGHVTALAWDTDDAMARLVAPRLDPVVRAWEFVPGARDGVPAETSTQLVVGVRATADADGGLSLRLLDAHTGAGGTAMAPPRYPSAALRANDEGRVIVEVAINADGSGTVIGSHVEATGSQRIFLDAARNAVKHWRFVPEIVGGQALPATIKVPVTFCTRGKLSFCPDGVPANAPTFEPAGSAVALKTPIADVGF
jgi:TonB family protein